MSGCEDFAAYSCSVDSPIATEWAVGIVALAICLVWVLS
mgnify:CR=1 FL=1